MPWPISLYQGPLSLPMSMPAAFQRSSSAIWVPERSPREMKDAPVDLMAFKASATSVMPLMPAGSLFGPIRTKSLYITGYRFTPKPSATNFSSCALACTNSTSASPRRPVSSAWPVPCATTFTAMPVLALNSGRMWPNRPESCVEVVEATTIDLSCARAGVDGAPNRTTAATPTTRRRVNIALFSVFIHCAHLESASCHRHSEAQAQRGSPESITTVAAIFALPVQLLEAGGYGLRARRFHY